MKRKSLTSFCCVFLCQLVSTFDALIVDISSDKISFPRSTSNAPRIRINDYHELRSKLLNLHYQLAGSRNTNTTSSSSWRWGFFKSIKDTPRHETTSVNCSKMADSTPPYSLSADDERLCHQFCSIVNNHLLLIARRAATYTITDIRNDNQRVSMLLEESFVDSYIHSNGSKKFGKAHDTLTRGTTWPCSVNIGVNASTA